MIQYKKLMMTLALLITAVGGAWAQDIATPVISGETEFYDKVTVTITCATSEVDIYYTLDGSNPKDDSSTSTQEEYKKAFTLTGTTTVKAAAYSGDAWSTIAEVKFVKKEVTWDAATKTGTFEMPDYDVEIAPIYAPKAKWATEGDAVLAPTAIEGIIAGTEDAIVKAGTVATGQGTAMYFATTDAEMTAENAAKADGWLSTLPTAAGYDDAQTVYVWYYIKGADTPQGETPTAENTFNDSEICTTPIEVTLLSNKFDIQFNAANANTIESGKATVKVGETAAEVKEGKVTGVKMDSKVTITAKEGYKFRKAEGKKGIVALLTLNIGGDCPGTITYAEGETWGQAIENHPTENTGWTIGSTGSILYNYYGVWLGSGRVKKEDAITPGLGYYTE